MVKPFNDPHFLDFILSNILELFSSFWEDVKSPFSVYSFSQNEILTDHFRNYISHILGVLLFILPAHCNILQFTPKQNHKKTQFKTSNQAVAGSPKSLLVESISFSTLRNQDGSNRIWGVLAAKPILKSITLISEWACKYQSYI